MSNLIEEPLAGRNEPEFSVSEISGAVKRVIEGEFARVRVRGEVGRVVLARTGHMYFDLKDDRAVLAAVSWKGQVARLSVRPEEGMEVVATGRLTTFPGQSKYQMIVDEIAPAGMGALMAMLEKRKAALAAEGLFAPERKKALPFLPEVIGVVTSPQGAVIRDILHRLRDRFPRKVLIWPVAVQGASCAEEVARAIRGFNALPAGGKLPRPDLLIVARGGGSIEDLWGFNEEAVVRAAAASDIPLISAVGHETDTTLIDFAADRRAPTPTAAAEMAVPVRMELLATVEGQGARLARAITQGVGQRGQRLRDLTRALPRVEALTAQAVQRLDFWGERLAPALRGATDRKRARFSGVAALVRRDLLIRFIAQERRGVVDRAARLERALDGRKSRLNERFAALAARLHPALARAGREAAREQEKHRLALAALAARLAAAPPARLAALRGQLEGLDRLRQTLGYRETLKRGYAVVRGDGAVVTGKAAAEQAAVLEIEFHDGRMAPMGRAARKARTEGPSEQGSLF